MSNTPFKFNLGQVVATPGVIAAAQESEDILAPYITRHHMGDWGDVDKHDAKANEQALKDGSRIFSVHHLRDKTKIYIITEAVGDDGKRASTCILLPDEY